MNGKGQNLALPRGRALLNNELQTSISAGEQERRDTLKRGNRFLGRVVACNGSRATIAAIAEDGGTSLTELWSVGRLISITVGTNRIVALVYSMQTATNDWGEDLDNLFRIEVELMGEVHVGPTGREEFSAGITQYPYLGAIAHRIRTADLARIYDTGKTDTCIIGKLTQDETLDATIHVPSMLSKHFAIVGTTGVGKSTAVTLLLHKAIASDPKLRVLILDPHNEFASAFPNHAMVIDTDTLDLPFWLMRLEEFAEVVFRGRPPVPEELDVLRDAIPEARKAFKGGSDTGIMKKQNDRSSVTADTPIPYRMADLLAAIDERIGRLEGRSEKPHLRSLRMKLVAAINDPRYQFMFSSNTINDTIVETITRIFRIPGEGRPITTLQLAGIPSEVVNSVASVLCRMAFEIGLWSNGGIHMLVVCEEAHRYVPADPTLGFIPTRQAIARIAKEGRKYGVSLGIITQRPGELDATILSQCSTVFAMRLANDHDQEIIRSAIPNSSISTTSFISSIGNGEAIAFGEAVAVPMRMRFSRVEENALPKANGVTVKVTDETPETIDIRTIVARMRAAIPSDAFGQPMQSPAAIGYDDGDDELESYGQAMSTSGPQAGSFVPPEMTAQRPPVRMDPAPAFQPERFQQLRNQLLSDEQAAASTPPRSGGSFGQSPPSGEPARAPSLRETLLKKPLGSMLRK